MDIEGLEALIGVVRTGNFTEAARNLNTSQPTLSRRISGFEDVLGVALIERRRGRAVPTEAGRVLLPHAEAALANVQDGLSAVRAIRQGHAGAIVLAFAPLMCRPDLIAALLRFKEKFPEVELSLRAGHSQAVSDLVRSGEATLGLRYRHDPNDKMTSTDIKTEQMVVICARNHPLAALPAVTIDQVSHETWIAVPSSMGEPDEGIRATLSRYNVRPDKIMPIPDLIAQKILIESGFGIGLVTRESVLGDLAAGRLHALNVPASMGTNVPVAMVMRKGGYLSEPARMLGKMIREEMSRPRD